MNYLRPKVIPNVVRRKTLISLLSSFFSSKYYFLFRLLLSGSFRTGVYRVNPHGWIRLCSKTFRKSKSRRKNEDSSLQTPFLSFLFFFFWKIEFEGSLNTSTLVIWKNKRRSNKKYCYRCWNIFASQCISYLKRLPVLMYHLSWFTLYIVACFLISSVSLARHSSCDDLVRNDPAHNLNTMLRKRESIRDRCK